MLYCRSLLYVYTFILIIYAKPFENMLQESWTFNLYSLRTKAWTYILKIWTYILLEQKHLLNKQNPEDERKKMLIFTKDRCERDQFFNEEFAEQLNFPYDCRNPVNKGIPNWV